MYVPAHQDTAPDEDVPEPDAPFPLLERYIDVVVVGALEYEPHFARKLLETTTGWSEYWLNDRQLAHRPWMQESRAATVDKLLATLLPHLSIFP